MARFRASKCGVVFAVIVFSTIVNGILCQSKVDELISEIVPSCVLGANQINYIIYNRNISTDGVVVDLNSSSIPVESGLPVAFLVHGFTSEANNSRYQNLTQAWLKKYDVNIISVDWKEGACSGGIALTQYLSYPKSIENAHEVGRNIAEFIAKLISDYGIPLENMLMVGHSLGAHVVGFSSKELQKENIGTIPQIIALDPAGPGFLTSPCSDRVCETDAEFLQVFHTSDLGIIWPLGDVDFYYNGGHYQPGCSLTDVSCSHGKAVDYLTYSFEDSDCNIIGKKWTWFIGVPPKSECSNSTCSIPGIKAYEYPARGSLYVDTKNLSLSCGEYSKCVRVPDLKKLFFHKKVGLLIDEIFRYREELPMRKRGT
ncbi:phospholipase A1 2-like [Diprion similis]|uniref:phospholipase A1 2-like n=1 Tax=Diprion similis TaxID=362088 RepID=UPI001EF90BCB|nr:phospholipase A1 2-like [Diprion similis]